MFTMSHRFKMAGKEEVKLSVVFGENVTQLFFLNFFVILFLTSS